MKRRMKFLNKNFKIWMRKALLGLALIGSAFAGGLQGQTQKQNPFIPKGWNVYLFGISYHLREGWKEAPRKLDSNGRWVFNPGIGIGAEWLKSPFESGFRP